MMKFNNLVFLFLLINCYLYATIINVPADQQTIQAGINVAVDGDTVLVQPGTYFENILFDENNITLASLFLTTQDTAYISQTIIDGNQEGCVVRFNIDVDSTAVLCGFTITNGSDYAGGGIRCCGGNPVLQNLFITENIADYNGGGGIFCEYASPSMINLKIVNNHASDMGGGIFCWKVSNPTLENVQIINNSADEYGGGIYCADYCDIIIANSVISDNTAGEYGGGIHNDYYCSITLENVTIRDNSAFYGGGICSSDLSSLSFDSANRCNIYSNIINNRGYGADIFAYECNVIVDTFTVLTPTDYYASPIEHFTFDILHEIGNPLINSDLYVSVDGDDTNSGITADEPLKTIRCALSKIYADSLNHNT
ncbi:MAG: hypothetical protein KAT74_11865, partial [Candidatus Cloacimonetes bacterium]|nr:hypothetical protein [Candidatus Cloacimonadota bacterium]